MIAKNIDVGYAEKQSNLAIRIEAHKRFSNFSLEDWLSKYMPLRTSEIILDLGCGNGNLFPFFSEKIGTTGLIVGIDKSVALLEEAKKIKVAAHTLLLNLDINSKLPFIDNSFNHIISSFSIYYVDDAKCICKEIKRLLMPNGVVFIIGPTSQNAWELYDFNERIFGFAQSEEVNIRTNRIEKEFLPLLKESFNKVKVEKIPSKLVFPNKGEFIKYYLATLLFEESVKRFGREIGTKELETINIPKLEISKEMIVLIGEKR